MYICRIFSLAESRWSTEGVKAVSLTREGNIVNITCSSSHLTSFAVLVDVGGAQVFYTPACMVSSHLNQILNILV